MLLVFLLLLLLVGNVKYYLFKLYFCVGSVRFFVYIGFVVVNVVVSIVENVLEIIS